ncbi:hypothetical protein INS49_014864 [Diaporthe citri]|uniref:uncharacterized protein n=1 Tax=Diaporthe citri TaxID=83186 RepID=UPI001C802089|nr:uncharacterized protein INS49_014864 [Diaporthe citri]KAG6356988.1 hypothetical protein INS49_014864 [Diaporthe citri]
MTQSVSFSVGPDGSFDSNQLNRDRPSLNPFTTSTPSPQTASAWSNTLQVASRWIVHLEIQIILGAIMRTLLLVRLSAPPSLAVCRHTPTTLRSRRPYRNSAPTENDGMTSDTGRASDASPPSPDQARRPLLAGPETQTRSFEGHRTTQGEARPGRFSMLRSFAASRQPSILLQRRHPAGITEATASPLSNRRTTASIAGGLTDDNLGNRTEPASGTGPSNRATTSNLTTGLDRLAITSSFAAHLASASNNTSQRPSITASGSPSLILRVSTNDGVTGARVNPRVGGSPSARSTPSVGGSSSSAGSARTVGGAANGRGTPAPGDGATANVAMPASGSLPVRASGAQTASGPPPTTGAMPTNGSLPGRTGGAQAAGDGPTADDTIIADGALPASGGAPAVGTMPAIGRVAYITVQSPDNRFYTVRVDLTDAAPNATYNITINIPPP